MENSLEIQTGDERTQGGPWNEPIKDDLVGSLSVYQNHKSGNIRRNKNRLHRETRSQFIQILAQCTTNFGSVYYDLCLSLF